LKILKKYLQQLEIIYSQIPGVPCNACGECCVSPTCTLLEFIFLLGYMLEKKKRADVECLLLRAPSLHEGYEGNLHCLFQDPVSRKCAVHPGRTMACRFFGLPAMDQLKIINLDNCRKMGLQAPGVNAEQLRTWMARLTDLNQSLAPFYSEPYWIAGFNAECWLAVYFDPLLNDGIFGSMKKILHDNLDLGFLEGRYADRTGLKDKTDKIALLYELIKIGDRGNSLLLAGELRNAYPYTGSYYAEELDKLEKLLMD
jgi:Fe-S-cluster containining protein